VWTEFIRSERYLEFMTFPRLLAFAEVAWRPRGNRDEQEFTSRLQPHVDALRGRGINARRESGDAFEFMTN
jgi:hexosaminidase